MIYTVYKINSKEDGIFFKAKHPGKILQQIMDERNISTRSLACKMGVSTAQLSEIIEGKRRIKRSIAIKLEDCLGIDAKFWLNSQEAYIRSIETFMTKWISWNKG